MAGQQSTTYFPHEGDLEVFYFHPDHLGSSSYITNLDGNVTQHMEYLPFGETLVDEHTNSNNSPFKFNGKELDEETGNYYYGARYYNPKWSIWLSVDPMAEKYPGWSPYSYTLNNPVRYTDPTGMVVEGPPDNIYLNDEGTVTCIDRNDNPNRFFASDGEELYFNDGKNLDEEMLGKHFEKGDQIYQLINKSDYQEMMAGTSFKPAEYIIKSSRELNKGNNDQAKIFKIMALKYAADNSKSNGLADFTKSQLEEKYNIMSGGGRFNMDNETSAYFRFGNSKTIYNWYDAGNSMWGGWMRLNGFSKQEVTAGSNIFELFRLNFGDSKADQRAINNGFLLKGYE